MHCALDKTSSTSPKSKQSYWTNLLNISRIQPLLCILEVPILIQGTFRLLTLLHTNFSNLSLLVTILNTNIFGCRLSPKGLAVKGFVHRVALSGKLQNLYKVGPKESSSGHWVCAIEGDSRTLAPSVFWFLARKWAVVFAPCSCRNVLPYQRPTAMEPIDHGLKFLKLWAKINFFPL